MDFYKLWSMNGYLGPFKMWSSLNYAKEPTSKDNNPFFTRYSQEYVEGIIGKMHFLLKFTGDTRRVVHNFIV